MKEKIQLIPYKPNNIIAKKLTLKKKEDYWKEIQNIKEEIIKLGYTPIDQTISYLEMSYQEENIDVLIGYTVKEIKPLEQNIYSLIRLVPSKSKYFLVANDKLSNIKELYQELFEYADNNKIQIRDFITGIIKEEEILLYVEAYNLEEENKDYLYYLEHHKIINEIDQELIGKYKLLDILPNSKYMYHKDKRKNKKISKWESIELKKDGTTNYKDMNWNKSELLLKIDDKTIPLPIHKHIINDEIYLEILMNETYKYYKSQRPMEYLYEKEKTSN